LSLNLDFRERKRYRFGEKQKFWVWVWILKKAERGVLVLGFGLHFRERRESLIRGDYFS